MENCAYPGCTYQADPGSKYCLVHRITDHKYKF